MPWKKKKNRNEYGNEEFQNKHDDDELKVERIRYQHNNEKKK